MLTSRRSLLQLLIVTPAGLILQRAEGRQVWEGEQLGDLCYKVSFRSFPVRPGEKLDFRAEFPAATEACSFGASTIEISYIGGAPDHVRWGSSWGEYRQVEDGSWIWTCRQDTGSPLRLMASDSMVFTWHVDPHLLGTDASLTIKSPVIIRAHRLAEPSLAKRLLRFLDPVLA